MSYEEITEAYLKTLLPANNGLIKEMEEYASIHKVPIMEQTGMQLLLQVLHLHQPKQILEVGTAIGYSAIRMAEAVKDSKVVTMERDPERIQVAMDNINRCRLQDRITLLEGDALEIENQVSMYGPFDVVFIDAAKGQYERFFHLYEPHVTVGGLIISDNVLFKGMVAGASEIPSKRLETMVKKLRKFNELLMNDPRFNSMIYPVGDGVMVSIKKSEKTSV
ncbi:MAG: O-methyltransferase [Bacillus sp. (in: Bacteria)]|nr:O-methyltransferase [Bacillus sp. (in: firmicutes)]